MRGVEPETVHHPTLIRVRNRGCQLLHWFTDIQQRTPGCIPIDLEDPANGARNKFSFFYFLLPFMKTFFHGLANSYW